MDIRGASITLPFKVDLLSRVAADDLSRRAGAVNTLVRNRGGWSGTNTDIAGFLSPLAGRMALNGVRAAVLGAGARARRALALSEAGARVVLHARRLSGARCGGGPGRGPRRDAAGGGKLGRSGERDPGRHGAARQRHAVARREVRWAACGDLVYNPQETRFLREAHAAGVETLGGLDMLVAQAEEQFELWTGELLARRHARGR